MLQVGQFHGSGGAVPLLGHDDFRHALVGRFLMRRPLLEVILPVQQDHHVGVLLDGTRLPEIAHAGTVPLPVFHPAVKLGKDHDRDIEFAGHGLESAGDLGDLLLPVLRPGSVHQLQVIHHDELDVETALEAAGLGPERGHGQGRGVVDEEPGLRQLAASQGQPGKLLFPQESPPHAVGIHPGEGAEHVLGQLGTGHFQGKEDGRLLQGHPHGHRHVEGEGGLPHAGTGRHHDQLAVLHPAQKIVQLLEAGGQARQAALATLEVVDLGEGFLEEFVEADRLRGMLVAGDIVDDLFRQIDQLGRRPPEIRGQPENLLGGPDQPAHPGFLRHDASVVFGVGRGGHPLDQFHQGHAPPHLFQQLLVGQGLLQRHQVDHLAAVAERQHLFVHPPVLLTVEIVGPEEGDDISQGLIIL